MAEVEEARQQDLERKRAEEAASPKVSPLAWELARLDGTDLSPERLAQLKQNSPLTSYFTPRELWKYFGYFILWSAELEKITECVTRLVDHHHLQAINHVGEHGKEWISGAVIQTPVDQLGQRTHERLAKRYHQRVKALYEEITGEVCDQITYARLKILVASKGYGDQPPHLDSCRDDGKTPAHSCLLFAGDCMSTWLPRYPLAYAKNMHPVSDPNTSPLVKLQPYAPLMDESYLHQIPVKAGHLIIFRHLVLHKGAANNSEQDRTVLFDMFIGKAGLNKIPESDQQRFIWLWYGQVFGWQSKEYYDCLEQNRKYDPLTHYNSDEEEGLREEFAKMKRRPPVPDTGRKKKKRGGKRSVKKRQKLEQ